MMTENIPGFSPICSICGKDLNKNIDVNCKNCRTVYCSEECLSKEDLCYVPEVQDIALTYASFDIKGKGENLPRYNGMQMIHFAGPISEPVPKTMFDVNKGEGKIALDHIKKITGKKFQNTFYLVQITDLTKLMKYQLTSKQVTELQDMMQKQAKEFFEKNSK